MSTVYAIFSHLNCCKSCNNYRDSLATAKKEESQKIDSWPVLVTCQSGISVMLFSDIEGPVVYESTQERLILLIDALK